MVRLPHVSHLPSAYLLVVAFWPCDLVSGADFRAPCRPGFEMIIASVSALGHFCTVRPSFWHTAAQRSRNRWYPKHPHSIAIHSDVWAVAVTVAVPVAMPVAVAVAVVVAVPLARAMPARAIPMGVSMPMAMHVAVAGCWCGWYSLAGIPHALASPFASVPKRNYGRFPGLPQVPTGRRTSRPPGGEAACAKS